MQNFQIPCLSSINSTRKGDLLVKPFKVFQISAKLSFNLNQELTEESNMIPNILELTKSPDNFKDLLI